MATTYVLRNLADQIPQDKMAAPAADTIINKPWLGFIGHFSSCFQCYPYKGKPQFLINFKLERHSYQTDPEKHFSEWFL